MFSVVRDVHKENFTVISNKVLMDERLSLAARGFFSIILSLPDDWDFSVRGMASICGISVDRAANCIKELQQHGYLIRERKKEGGRFNDFDYCFYEKLCTEDPDMEKPDTEKPDTEKPDTEKPDMEKPDTENSAQQNTNIQNTKIQNTNKQNTKELITKQTNSPQEISEGGVQFITSMERREQFSRNIHAQEIAAVYGESFVQDALKAMELLSTGIGRLVNGERVEGEELKKYMLLVREEDVRIAQELVSGKELKNYVAYFGSVLFNTVRERIHREERERARSQSTSFSLPEEPERQDSDTQDVYENIDIQALMDKIMQKYRE